MRAFALCVLAVLATCSPFGPGEANAATCAGAPVEARGEPSRYLWLAKLKARGNWRLKVRGMPGLGPDYANWARAEATEEKCLSGPAGHLCIFTGTPCHK